MPLTTRVQNVVIFQGAVPGDVLLPIGPVSVSYSGSKGIIKSLALYIVPESSNFIATPLRMTLNIDSHEAEFSVIFNGKGPISVPSNPDIEQNKFHLFQLVERTAQIRSYTTSDNYHEPIITRNALILNLPFANSFTITFSGYVDYAGTGTKDMILTATLIYLIST